MGFGEFLTGLGDFVEAATPLAVTLITGERPRAPGPVFVGEPSPNVVEQSPFPGIVSQQGRSADLAVFDPSGLQVPGTDLTIRNPFASTAGVTAMELMRSPFIPSAVGATSKIFVMANPVTGKPTWFGPKGRPLLWSGDLRACKRVKKIARRAKRAGG